MFMKIKVVNRGVRCQAPSAEMAAWQFAHKAESVRSAENMAALMAPEDHQSAHLQGLEDSCLRRMWRLIKAFGKVGQGVLQKKMLENDVRSRNVYENKGSLDRKPEKKSDIFDLDSDIFG